MFTRSLTNHGLHFIASCFLLVVISISQNGSRAQAYQSPSVQLWSMGFWEPGTMPVSSIDWGGLTHVIQVAAGVNPDGSLAFVCSTGPCGSSEFAVEASEIVGAAHSHDVQILLDINSAWGSAFPQAIESNLGIFANNVLEAVDAYGYDGVDIDWEGGGLNYSDMTSLLASLRQQLGTKLLVADAVVNDYAYWGSVQQYLDRVNVMSYDLTGTWTPYSWFNSALYSDPCKCVWSLDLAKRRFLAHGVPLAKLNLGIPFYGWVSEGGISGPRQLFGALLPVLKQIRYSTLVTNFNISNPTWDTVGQVPWIQTPTGWITFDNAQSIAAKINYIKSNNLGGWFIWSLNKDYLAGQNPSHPLLDAVKDAMSSNSSPTAP